LVKDDADLVRSTVERQLAAADVDVIITTGGTGITSRDSTYEAISGLLHKRLDGFGELFRMLSFEQIGAAAMMSRACAGLAAGRIVVSLPGSEAAVRLAMERLIIPELGHMVQQARR
jgi:molybdenum cofactor biosynthesis protein B